MFETLKKDLQEEKHDLAEKLDEVKEKFQKACDDLLEQKIEFSRDIALSN